MEKGERKTEGRTEYRREKGKKGRGRRTLLMRDKKKVAELQACLCKRRQREKTRGCFWASLCSRQELVAPGAAGWWRKTREECVFMILWCFCCF